jgi:hypothetical protein
LLLKHILQPGKASYFTWSIYRNKRFLGEMAAIFQQILDIPITRCSNPDQTLCAESTIMLEDQRALEKLDFSSSA